MPLLFIAALLILLGLLTPNSDAAAPVFFSLSIGVTMKQITPCAIIRRALDSDIASVLYDCADGYLGSEIVVAIQTAQARERRRNDVLDEARLEDQHYAAIAARIAASLHPTNGIDARWRSHMDYDTAVVIIRDWLRNSVQTAAAELEKEEARALSRAAE